METKYIVISTSEDGIYIEEVGKEKLLERLEEGYWGEKDCNLSFPSDRDPMYWGSSLTIIKGNVVVPQAVETVTRFQLP